MLGHLPPQLHLIIATRADPPLPLSKLRVRGEMVELRAAELRFAPDETAEFFGRSAGVELLAEDVAKLEERTEGWPAGLQIAALAIRDHADVAGFIDAFAGSNRHVVDYLAEEVVERQPDHVRTFLLRTSILERMCAPLCEVVVEHGE
jgi:LuxR family maltose regulon positive regulatory protein